MACKAIKGNEIEVGKKVRFEIMRRKFGKLINELAKKDDKIVLLVGDIEALDDLKITQKNSLI